MRPAAEQEPEVNPTELQREYLERAQALVKEPSLSYNNVRCKTIQRDLIPFVYY
jgi:hypothetical protein